MSERIDQSFLSKPHELAGVVKLRPGLTFKMLTAGPTNLPSSSNQPRQLPSWIDVKLTDKITLTFYDDGDILLEDSSYEDDRGNHDTVRLDEQSASRLYEALKVHFEGHPDYKPQTGNDDQP